MKEAYIIDGVRTPIGSYQGTLSAVRTDDLAALVIEEIVKKKPKHPQRSLQRCDIGLCQSSWGRQSECG